jgi:hypothetical protein
MIYVPNLRIGSPQVFYADPIKESNPGECVSMLYDVSTFVTDWRTIAVIPSGDYQDLAGIQVSADTGVGSVNGRYGGTAHGTNLVKRVAPLDNVITATDSSCPGSARSCKERHQDQYENRNSSKRFT